MKKEDLKLKNELDAIVSALDDFITKHHLNLFLVAGNVDYACTSFLGTRAQIVPIVCSAATEQKPCFDAVMYSAELLASTAKQGFDFEAVHSGKSTSSEQFQHIINNINKKKDN